MLIPSPLHYGLVGHRSRGKQVVPVVEQLVLFAAVSHPDVRHTGHTAGQTQQVLPGAAVLVCNQQALIGCLTLQRGQEGERVC